MKSRKRAMRMEWVEAGRCCFWCDKPFEKEKDGSPIAVSAEHFIPLAFGGQDKPGNIVFAHSWCNHQRAARLPSKSELRLFLAIKGEAGLKMLLRHAARYR